jgi:hypothetical protein
MRIGRSHIQSLYLGKRPNCIRIYDKVAEYQYQYRKLTRKAPDVAAVPTFESLYGVPQEGVILTRVERQAGGGRVPAAVQTLTKLKQSLEFNPFEQLDFLANAAEEPQIAEWGIQKYGFGMWLRDQVEAIGVQRLRSLLHRHSGRHAAKLLREFSPFFPVEAGITAQRLYETYRKSLERQLAA